MKSTEHCVVRLTRGGLAHSYEFFGIVLLAHSGLKQLHFFEINQDAAEFLGVSSDAFFKGISGFDARDDVYVSSLALTKSTETFDLWVCF